MKDAQKPDHISLNTLIGRLKEGRFVVPDFQREFEWMPWDIRDLMRSIFLDYFIGSLLVWKGKKENFEALACEPIYGYSGNAEPEHIVLDGQQRLTAMYYAFLAPNKPAPGRANRFVYHIKVSEFMDEAYDRAFDYDWTQGGVNLHSNRSAQFEKHIFPLSVLGKGGWELATWCQEYEAHWRKKAEAAEASANTLELDVCTRSADNAHGFGEHLRGITEQYQVAYIELDRDLAIDKVCDIFTQINSKGIRLDVFDLVNALLKPKGLQLKLLWREAAPKLEFVDTERMNVYVLQVMSILKQAYCSPKYLYYLLPGQEKTVREPDGSLRKEVLVQDTTAFLALWEQAVAAISKAIDLLRHPQEYGAISSEYLPYVSIVPAFAALQVAVQALPPNRQLDAQRKARHWYWASVFTNRYSGSVESTIARDFTAVKAWFDDDEREPPMIEEFRARFRSLDLRKEVKRGTSVYNAIFNLLILKGARDWMTGSVPLYGDLDDHHIVPKSWSYGRDMSNSIDTILNRTPLTSDTNRNVIRDRLPNAYLPDLIEQNGEAQVRTNLESHLISPAGFDILLHDPFTEADYDAFLQERQRSIQDAIEDLLVKERLDLSPRLHEMDDQIEQIELALRVLVAHVLANDVSRLPSHIQDKVEDRIQGAARKNPAMDLARYSLLVGRLEYCDMREIEAAIVSRTNWPGFEPRFGTKEMLGARLTTLADLRNGIRHSRTVDEVTQKDGEAALLWFQGVLSANLTPHSAD